MFNFELPFEYPEQVWKPQDWDKSYDEDCLSSLLCNEGLNAEWSASFKLILCADSLWVELWVHTEVHKCSYYEIETQEHKSKQEIAQHVVNYHILILSGEHVKDQVRVLLFNVWEWVNDQNHKLKKELPCAEQFKPFSEVWLLLEFLWSLVSFLLNRSRVINLIHSHFLLLLFFFKLMLQLQILNLELFGVLEIHPERVEPISEKQRNDGQESSNSDNDSNEGIFLQILHCSIVVIECCLILIIVIKILILPPQLQAPNQSLLECK